MKKVILTFAIFCIMNMIQAQNPFLEKYTTPHGTAPFDRIKKEHFEPAL